MSPAPIDPAALTLPPTQPIDLSDLVSASLSRR
ncbi:hypothetical protein FHS08_002247 [Microbacterium ulmi]|nr:hypothetical protein [Microbacterium ulmi]